MNRQSVTPENLKAVLDRLIANLQENEEMSKDFCESFDAFLDDLAFDDFFGTERQLDPRGDPRE